MRCRDDRLSQERSRSGNGFDRDRGVLLDHSIESVDWISSVRDGSARAIGFDQAVATLDDIPVARFLLSFVVALNIVRKKKNLMSE